MMLCSPRVEFQHQRWTFSHFDYLSGNTFDLKFKSFGWAAALAQTVVVVACLVVGARLIIKSESFADVILNALAATFVNDVDDLCGKMVVSCLVFDDSLKVKVKRLEGIRTRQCFAILLSTQILPAAMTAVLCNITYW